MTVAGVARPEQGPEERPERPSAERLGEPAEEREATTADGFRVLAVAIRRERAIFTLSTIGSALFGALTVADAWVLGWATDHVLLRDHPTRAALWGVLALFVGVAILRAVGVIARRLGAGVMQYRMQAHSRRALTRQYLRLPLAWHQQHPTGQLLSNANSDVEAAWSPIAPLPMAVGTIAMMLIAVGQMLVADAVMALVGLLVFPAVIAVNMVFQRVSQPLMTRAQQLRAELSEVAHESFDGALVVKTLGREAEESARFAAKAAELREVNILAGRYRAAFDPVITALPSIGVLAVLVVGVERVIGGASAVGDVVQVAYLLTIVAFPIRSIGWLLGEFPRSVVGYDRIASVLEATGEMEYGAAKLDVEDRGASYGRSLPSRDPRDVRGAEVRVERLGYAYVPGEPLLRGVAFDVAPGRSLAIVGATASGKSTLTQLLARLVDPDEGRILLDGIDLRDLAHGEVAGSLAVVPQQAFLFDDTVRGNVTLGADLDEEEVWAALRVAQAEAFVAGLPEGLDTRLGERGTSLSGGQRQRISLARALVRRPRVLVLDDATSAVDPEVEQRILAGLRGDDAGERGGDRTATLILVAYRKATIALADEVVHLAGGVVADRGTHEDLLGRSPAYARLVNAYEADLEADLQDELEDQMESGRA